MGINVFDIFYNYAIGLFSVILAAVVMINIKKIYNSETYSPVKKVLFIGLWVVGLVLLLFLIRTVL